MRKLAILALMLATPAAAQQPAFAPLDEAAYNAMLQAFAQISMPLTAHQQVQQIMQAAERESAARAQAKRAADEKPAAAP